MDLELLRDGKRVDTIDFGTPETGSKNTLVLQLRNNSAQWSIYGIECSLKQSDELKIAYPEFLRPSETADVIITWNPKFERREPLLVSETFTGQLIIG